ncbi:MAG: zinc ABC transporter permease [Acidipropionibacterium sp.]|jgi:O-antigen ligase|nr:zinc ABC transporter permease [Acidipropionibacterium sp.]
MTSTWEPSVAEVQAQEARTTRLVQVRERLIGAASQTRVFELLVGVALTFSRVSFGSRLPIEILLVILVLGVAAFRRPTLNIHHIQLWVVMLMGAMLIWAVAVSVWTGQPWTQRAFRIFLLFLFAVCIAQGRIYWKSIVVGGAAGLIFVNAPSWFLGVGAENYVGNLTGWLVDKNVSGMFYGIFAVLGLCLFTHTWYKVVYFVVMFGLLWLTGSRTSIAGCLLALVWWFLRPRAQLWLRLVAAAVGVWVLVAVESRWSQVGEFSDRTGTDWYRHQIDMATSAKLAITPWYGQGLNTGWVALSDTRTAFFHNSYAQLRVEGGWPLVVAMLMLVVIVAFGIFGINKEVSGDQRAIEAGIVVLLVCAWKIGEAFFTLPCLFLVGAAIAERYGTPVVAPSPVMLRVNDGVAEQGTDA